MEDLDYELDDSIVDDVLADASVASDALLEDSFSSTTGTTRNRPLCTSTPSKEKPTRTRPIPSMSSTSAATRLRCSQCSNTYANERTLAVHVRMHAMKAAASRLPKAEAIEEFTKEAVLKSFKEIYEEIPKSEAAESLSEYCLVIEDCIRKGEGELLIQFISRSFHNILRSQNVILPSALRFTVRRQTNKLHNSKEFRQKVKDLCSSLKPASSVVLNLFVGCVCEKIFFWQLTFTLRVLRGRSFNDSSQTRKRYSSDAQHPKEFQQLVYYIGGFILHGIVKKSKLYSSNPNWAVYGEIVTNKFTSPSPVPESECFVHAKSFTACKNRGGLTFCNEECFSFFLFLFDMLMSLEGEDGSLPFEVAENHIFDNDLNVVLMWDDLVGAELSEEQSLYLLTDIVRCCVKVIVKGILKRRLNEHLAKSYSSVPLRQRIAR